MDLLLLLLLSALLAGGGAALAKRKAVPYGLAGVVLLYLLMLANELWRFDGFCYAFVGERWSCTRAEHFLYSMKETLFLGGAFIVIWLLVYAFFYTFVYHLMVIKREKK